MPVGSARVVERVLDRPDVNVVSNPEFLREGSAVQDFLNPDRIVVGSTDQAAAIKVSSLYLGVAAPVIVTDPASAETIKYAANAFLATKLSFVNAVAAICEGVGADVNDVVLGLGYDKRIGKDFLRPGPGWGGSCFPKDTRALLKIADDAGYSFDMLQGVVAVNDEQFERVTDKVVEAAGGDVAGKTIGVWGLTFKARTDDLRESPSIAIIERLLAKGATVKAHDPTVSGPKAGLPTDIVVCDDPYEVADGADVLVVLTEWEDYRWLDAGRVADDDDGACRRRLPQPARPQRVPARRVHLRRDRALTWPASSSPAAPASSARTCAGPCSTAATASSPSTTSSRARSATSRSCSATAGSRSSSTTSASTCGSPGRSTR